MDFKDIKNAGTAQLLGNKRTISGDNIFVGEGVLKCNSYFLSLDSICVVEMGRNQNPSWYGILFSIVGVLMCLMPYMFIAGIIMVIFGIFIMYIIGKINEKIPYSLTIRLSNNMSFTYQSLNRVFMEEIMEVIQSCINDRRGGYNILLNQGKIEHNNNSINISGNNGSINDVIAQGGSKTVGRDSINTTGKQENGDIGLTVEEWENLERFFMMRQKEFQVNEINYMICGNLLTYSREKNMEKLKKYLGRIGRETTKTILNVSTNVAATEVVRPIIEKILS